MLGQVDDFLQAFDDQRQAMLDQFQKTDQHWTDKLKSFEEGKDQGIGEVNSLTDQI